MALPYTNASTCSKGHVTWLRKHDGSLVELYDRDGELYLAPAHNTLDVRSGYRFGRWECARVINGQDQVARITACYE